MVGGSCGVKNLFALAVPVWRVCARVAPAEPFPGVGLRGGFGAFPCGVQKKFSWYSRSLPRRGIGAWGCSECVFS